MSKVHLLGVGAMGSLLSHELVQAHPHIIPNFTMLFKDSVSFDSFKHQDSKLVMNKLDNTSSFSTINSDYRVPVESKIENLIVATKTHQTTDALRKYVDHITPDTNILLLQNGMGMLEHLNLTYWPYPERRPTIYQCISTHGAFKSSPFVVNHVGIGRLDIAKVTESSISDPSSDAASPYSDVKEMLTQLQLPEFIRDILSTKALNAHYLAYPQFLLKQIEKLIINTCINPLTAIFDCLNGELLYSPSLTKTMKKVIGEDVKVFKAEFPLLETIPDTEAVLDEDRLLQLVIQVCRTTAKNSSSMREDVRLLKNTEIHWINGYIMNLAKKHDISANTNQFMLDMVREKLAISRATEKHSINTVLSQVNENLK